MRCRWKAEVDWTCLNCGNPQVGVDLGVCSVCVDGQSHCEGWNHVREYDFNAELRAQAREQQVRLDEGRSSRERLLLRRRRNL